MCIFYSFVILCLTQSPSEQNTFLSSEKSSLSTERQNTQNLKIVKRLEGKWGRLNHMDTHGTFTSSHSPNPTTVTVKE